MPFRKAVLLIVALALPPANARALETDTQAWGLFAVQGSLSRDFLGYFELQPRFGDDISSLEQLLVRPALGYKLAKLSSAWLGYLLNQRPQTGTEEHRIWQQFLHESRIGGNRLFNRTRLEQRFLPDIEDTAVRFRHMIRLLSPISEDARWSLAFWDELFLNFNSVPNGPSAGFDQNRFFAGISHKPSAWLRLEPGYMANFVNQTAPRDNRLNHVAYLMVWVSLK